MKQIFEINPSDSLYPRRLLHFLGDRSPRFLAMGNIDLLLKKACSFSGSRKASDKGLALAKDLSMQMAEAGVCVVSGNAYGIDCMAHRSCLEAGGFSIFVLPEGFSSFSIRPELRDIWDWGRVLVLSQFGFDDKWSVARAMARNTTIVLLGHAVIVVECKDRGGSFSAGKSAVKFKVPLFVPKYTEWGFTSLGNKKLIENGANIILKNTKNKRASINQLIKHIGIEFNKDFRVDQLDFLELLQVY